MDEVKLGMTSGTQFGGLLTVSLAVFIVVQIVQSSIIVFVDRGYQFEKLDIQYSDKEISETLFTTEEFDNSLNFAFGIVAPDSFDVQNNPYIEFKAYSIEYTDTTEETLEKFELHKCSKEELLRYLKQKNIDLNWYPNPLCIKDRKNFGLRGNWHAAKYSMPTISIVACKNTTENGNWCKPMDEIVNFVKTKDFYFIHQQTQVVPDMYSDHKDVDEFPHNGDRENYFPTTRL